ncbi:MAG: decarboxylating 6-phosphogluconate dehydrogenase [Actinomycetota bacterium]|nr:decarboxylating 6-phosphogluconate dehydrogenase [Actinomycetota bacterium]
MRIGMIGLGRMGSNMTTRLLNGGHEVVVFDLDAGAVRAAGQAGANPAGSLEHLVTQLDRPRAIWIMVPSGSPTASTLDALSKLLDDDDVVIDGGNSRYTDTIARARSIAEKGIHFIDAGTSGGIWGLEQGFCLMVGADREIFDRLRPIFETLAPPGGYTHVGPPGAGHFVKMVHNGIEYALMQAYAEGFELLRSSDMDLDLAAIAEVWRHGSVIRSWLLDLAADALKKDPELANVASYVEDSGEGRWTIETAIDNAVPTPIIALSLMARFASRQDESFSAKLLAALRREFGGHDIHTEKDTDR